MAEKFDFSQAVQEIVNNNKTGHWQITTESVRWDVYWQEGKILYAQHSLQSLETLTYHLMRVSPTALAKLPTNLAVNPNHHFRLLPIVQRIYDSKIISYTEKLFLIKEITQDALESLLCLSEGKSEWLTIKPEHLEVIKVIVGENLFEAKSLLKLCQLRLQQWKQLSPLIVSPHQRPLLAQPALFNTTTVGQGNLSKAILAQLTKLMRGLSLRQLSFLLKQDELKFAQLLYPYVQQGVVTIHPPKAPLDELPTVLPRQESRKESYTPAVIQIATHLGKPPEISKLKEEDKKEEKVTPSPVVSEESKSSAHTEKLPAERKYTIVCIDDSPTALQTMKKYLSEEGFEVVTVDNPMKSVSYLFQAKPDLILMDLSMPGINGSRLSQILKSSSVFKDVPIVVVSGNASSLGKWQLREMGAKDFLAKPFTKEQLLAVVKKCLADRFSPPVAAVKYA